MIHYTTRYQHAPWYERARRWILWMPRAPFWALRMWWSGQGARHDDWRRLPIGFYWSLALGEVDCAMNHLYDWDSIRKKFREEHNE